MQLHSIDSCQEMQVLPNNSRQKLFDAPHPPTSALRSEHLTAKPTISMNNFPPSAALGRTQTYSSAGSIGTTIGNTNATVSPISPKGKRKRIHTQELSSSPGSAEDGYEGSGEKRRPPGVKRACNECRQQKVRRQKVGEYGIEDSDDSLLCNSYDATL